MATDEFNEVLSTIRARVAEAVASTGMGAKPFAQKNRMGETVVRDLVKAHNKDVQLSTLSKIAAGAGVPLVALLPAAHGPIVTARSLERAIADALPGLPEDEDRRAGYLASTVARVLQLPEGLRDEPANDATLTADAPAKASPPRKPTK